MFKLPIIGILKKLDELSKSNPLRAMTNGSKNKKTKRILPDFDKQETPLWQF